MKTIFTISAAVLMSVFLFSCSNDDDAPQALLSIEDLSVSIDENPQANAVIGTFSTNQENLNDVIAFTITEQSVAGAMTINAEGQLVVADVTAFNFEANPTITGVVTVNSGNINDTADFTITINDVVELNPSLSLEDLSANIDENPEADAVVGSFIVNQTDLSEALGFEIVSQSVMGAIRIDAQGQLLVADASAFDFETNPTITGEVRVTSGSLTDTATFNISLNDVNEIPADAFVTEWELTAGNLTIRLPIHAARPLNQIITEYDFQVDWGDGTVQQVTSFDDPDAIHTYASPGKKTVIITGTLRGFSFFEGSGVSSSLLTNVSQWGTVLLGNSVGHFINCTNLTGFTATDVPDISEILSLERMFNNASSFTGGISNWDVSNVEVMTNMFSGASAFNEDISGWNVSKVNAAISMFFDATSFNQDISGWDVSSLLFVDAMFFNASSFNQDLSGWATDNVFSCDEFNGGTSALTTANLPTRGPCL